MEGTVGAGEPKVVVKDFGLATMLVESSDLDCGSALYVLFGAFSSHHL